MGDRANIIIRQAEGQQVILYGHWSGEEYVARAKQALAKRWRWDDAAYLARIVYDCFVGDQAGTETGFGISTTFCDGEHPVLVIDVERQRVYFEAMPGRSYTEPSARAANGWTFEEFVNLRSVPRGGKP